MCQTECGGQTKCSNPDPLDLWLSRLDCQIKCVRDEYICYRETCLRWSKVKVKLYIREVVLVVIMKPKPKRQLGLHKVAHHMASTIVCVRAI